MSIGKLIFSQDLVYFFNGKVSKTEAISILISLLEKKGYVKPSFKQAVLDREEVFPTGLPTQPVAVAIPHTDSLHVNQSALAVGILKKPVSFIEMGTTDTKLSVSVISILAISDKNSMVEVLRHFALVFRDQDFIKKISGCVSAQEALDLYTHTMRNLILVQ